MREKESTWEECVESSHSTGVLTSGSQTSFICESKYSAPTTNERPDRREYATGLLTSGGREYFDSTSSLKISHDPAKARSLVDTAKGRIEFLKSTSLAENNANYIFEGYYSSALEMLHALVLQEGYKVSNHLCLGYYLRDVLEKDHLFMVFDDCRYKRNSLVYYGRKMDFETAKIAIEKCLRLIKEIDLLLKEGKKS